MKRAVAIAAVMVAALAIGPATASAAKSPQLIACLGAGTNDGSFQNQAITVGSPIGIQEQLCVFARPASLQNSIVRLITGLSATPPPSGLPTQTDINNLVSTLQTINPTDPFSALSLAFAVCQALHASNSCSNVTGTVLSSLPFPLGTTELQGTSSDCFAGKQTGTGFAAAFPDAYSLDWTADYSSTNGLIGVMGGTATALDGTTYKIQGGIGLGCGAGAKGLVLLLT